MMKKSYLRPLSSLYSQVVTLKNFLYDRQWLSRYDAKCKVISVGNLTMGGTGKTPLVDFLVKILQKKGLKVAVISRSYRAEVQQPHQVDEQIPRAAFYFGDEPVQLALANPGVDFYVGPQKSQTAQYAVSQKHYDVLLVDDGFQHRRLRRDLDIVVLDATEEWQNYEPLPEGRARESWHSLQRAQLIVVTKCNWVSEEKLSFLSRQIPKNIKVVYVDYDLPVIRWIFEKRELPWAAVQDRTAFLISAIARPQLFKQQMSKKLKVVGERHFRDHHPYSIGDVNSLLNEFQESGAELLLTTEKDSVKLRSFISEKVPLVVAPLQVTERGSEGVFNEILSSIPY